MGRINTGMSGKIYLICKDGEPKYVGFTSQTIQARWARHCKDAYRKSKFILHKAIRKYGPEAFTIELIADYLNEDFALNVCEEFWIKHLGTHVNNGGYNMTLGGEKPPSWLGKTHTDEWKKKQSETKRGEKSPNFGKSRTKESIDKQMASRKAKYDAFVADEVARGTKRCSRCKTEKPFTEFRKDASKRHGIAGWCKDCERR